MQGGGGGRGDLLARFRAYLTSLLSSAASLSSRASVGLNEKAATWWLWRLQVEKEKAGGDGPVNP